MDTKTIIDAIDDLKEGRPVVFPTDTVYGVGVAVQYAESPQELYKLKGRHANKPIAWLVGGPEALDEYGADVPDCARQLAQRHWPGALTIIVKASDAVSPAFRSASGTIGLRMPANAVAQRLVRVVGPLATTSANLSGEADVDDGEELDPKLVEKVASVLVDDDARTGNASTVVDCSQGEVVVMREGDVEVDTTFTVSFEYVSHDQDTDINARLWTSARFGTPDNPGEEAPRGVVQIIHGMSEHIDRYDEFARYLVGRGFIVCAEDHVGHGGSVLNFKQYGHIPIEGGRDIVVGDVHTLHSMMQRAFPDVPYVLLGHSMGSFIARAYIAEYGDELSACVLSGTGNVAVALSKLGNGLAHFIASIRGETHRSKLIDKMGAGAYSSKIKGARTPFDWLSTDPKVVDAYIADDRCGFMFTVGGYATLLDLTGWVASPECAAEVPKGLPVFLVAGAEDPVGDMGKGVDAATELLRKAGVLTVDEKIYPGMRHEILNEPGRWEVYDDIVTWIEQHL